jgi:hypothetical protein
VESHSSPPPVRLLRLFHFLAFNCHCCSSPPSKLARFFFFLLKKKKKKKDKNQVITSRRSTRHLHSKIGCGGWEGPFASVSFSPVVIPQTQGVRIHAKVLRLGSWNFSPGRKKKERPVPEFDAGHFIFFSTSQYQGVVYYWTPTSIPVRNS